jgi:hypothetical protein
MPLTLRTVVSVILLSGLAALFVPQVSLAQEEPRPSCEAVEDAAFTRLLQSRELTLHVQEVFRINENQRYFDRLFDFFRREMRRNIFEWFQDQGDRHCEPS